ncbi:sensor histidine kinase [Bacillus sp. 03113]|uniref:sensor histidine kinase n=1 Tax=Bacillus sp. 03113 TaxID=2578211 RepID=UPI00215BE44B|nr:sensor histidine kinase [Bacillus sp. 03113]
MEQKKRSFYLFPSRFGFFPYIFLIYLLMPGFYIAAEKGTKMILGYVLLALFLVTYRQLYVSIERKNFSYWLALQLIIILVLSCSYNIYNVYLGFFPAHFIGWYSNKKSFYKALICLGVVILVPVLWSITTISMIKLLFLFPFIIVMMISPFGIRSMNKKMELERQLDDANNRIRELVKREERMRIARDLHDTLGHTFSLITLKSQLVDKLIDKNPEKARMEAKEIEKTSRAALRQVRELVSDMRTVLVQQELIEIEEILKTAGISFHLKESDPLENVPHLTHNILSMCLREAITNIVKHSKASACSVKIKQVNDEITISVHDNGIGFISKAEEGNGLKGIKERLELINGTLEVLTQSGALLMMTVPVIMSQVKEGVI